MLPTNRIQLLENFVVYLQSINLQGIQFAQYKTSEEEKANKIVFIIVVSSNMYYFGKWDGIVLTIISQVI